MTYQQDYEEDLQPIFEETFDEETFDEIYNKSQNTLKNIKEDLQYSYNSDILMLCTPYDLMHFVETGKFELPEQNYTKTNNIIIPEPIEYVSEEEDLSCWMTVTANGLVPTYQTKNEKVEEVKKQAEKLEAIRAKDESNKHNWTMTREERGLPKVQPKPVKKESKSSKRRRRRFKINKSKPVRPTLNTIQEKPKSKYQPKRIAHKYE
jgi:hypothetical protein